MAMNEETFWYIIDISKKFAKKEIRNTREQNQLQYRYIVEELKYYTPTEIIEFERIFRRLINRATCHNIEDWIFKSDDRTLYFKCWLISQGRHFFSNSIYHPFFLAHHILPNQYDDFSDMLYVSTEAFLVVTGKPYEDDECPRGVCDAAKLNYDSYPVEVQGATLSDEMVDRLTAVWEQNYLREQ